MNNLLLASVVIAAATTLSAPLAIADDKVFGFSAHYVERDIEAQGFNVVDVAEWGNYIVATVVNDDGHKSFKYFDPNSRQLVR